MQKSEVLAQIRAIGVVPVLRLSSARDVLAMAEALHAAHIDAVEIPLDVPDALAVISNLVQRFDEKVLVGAGTVLDTDSTSSVIAAGASFVTSPSFDAEIVKYCNSIDVAVFPGALSPTEIVSAWKAGADMVKVFPCSALGGPSYLKAIKTPLPQIALFPSGGVTLQNAAAYIEAGASILGVGSDLVDLASLREGRADRIVERARLFIELARDARGDAPTPPPATASSLPRN
ncbi:MAG TPA: bifunctional 4-hydroxy-2-oxoglutarate aldolase/2-dehydro-3-deoxy-phosphogluconate aldolase [Polyangia bacterium]|jgi:2-dehydro-3-deoxyphosphogluconate aldolase/(4S)-4-hydroxy-2-oxoglutarate aldolase|nr:bifunctional 4-hydroxy-2-oxoglutarate aldolase/2-dehydro-3-deoxy-phosphogluconate aldolase [Polyangia bacterium]